MSDRRTARTRVMHWSFASEDRIAARAVRHSFVAFAAAVGDEDAALDTTAAELVIGELVSNVERHAPGPASVEVELQPHCIIVTVADAGPGFELVPQPQSDVLAETGRGLFLVDSCSRELTVRAAPRGGCEVRAVIALDPPGGALRFAAGRSFVSKLKADAAHRKKLRRLRFVLRGPTLSPCSIARPVSA